MAHKHDPPFINMFFVMFSKFTGHSFFTETTVTSTSYLDMLQHVTVPHLQQDTDIDLKNSCQQDGATLH
jgi:hypothetical protein